MGYVSLAPYMQYNSGGWSSAGDVTVCYQNEQVCVDRVAVSLSSGESLTSLSVSTNFALWQYTYNDKDYHTTTITAYLYEFDPTGGSTSPPGGAIGSATLTETLGYWGKYLTFNFSGLSSTASSLYVWFYDAAGYVSNTGKHYKDAVYFSATGNEYTKASACAATFTGGSSSGGDSGGGSGSGESGSGDSGGGDSGGGTVTPTVSHNVILKYTEGIISVSGGGYNSTASSFQISCSLQPGYNFNGWYLSDESGNLYGLVSSSQDFTFVPTETTTYLFASTVKASDTDVYSTIIVTSTSGIMSTSGGGYNMSGSQFTLSCTLVTGSTFTGWYKSNANGDLLYVVSSSQTFQLTPDENPYYIKATATVPGADWYSVIHLVRGDDGIKYFWENPVEGYGDLEIIAVVNSGYTFYQWYRLDEDGNKVLVSHSYDTKVGPYLWGLHEVTLYAESCTGVELEIDETGYTEYINLISYNLYPDTSLEIVRNGTYYPRYTADKIFNDLIPGQYSQLTVHMADEYSDEKEYVFLGWYNGDGELVCETPHYVFTMPEEGRLVLTAKAVPIGRNGVCIDGERKQFQIYIYKDGEWHEATAYVYVNGEWKETKH